LEPTPKLTKQEAVSAGENVVSSLTMGVSKAIGEVINASNSSLKRSFVAKQIKKFHNLLIKDKNSLSCFDDFCNDLIKIFVKMKI